MAYGFRRIGVVTSIPSPGTKPGDGDAALAYQAELGSVLEITAKATNAAAGKLTLLRWFPPPQEPVSGSTISALGEWRRWREDAPIQVPLCPDVNFVSGRYEQADDSTEYYLLLGSNSGYGGGTPQVVADAQCVYYRGRK